MEDKLFQVEDREGRRTSQLGEGKVRRGHDRGQGSSGHRSRGGQGWGAGRQVEGREGWRTSQVGETGTVGTGISKVIN